MITRERIEQIRAAYSDVRVNGVDTEEAKDISAELTMDINALCDLALAHLGRGAGGAVPEIDASNEHEYIPEGMNWDDAGMFAVGWNACRKEIALSAPVQAEAVEDDRIANLAMMVRRMTYKMRHHGDDGMKVLADTAEKLLRRYGLQGSPLRGIQLYEGEGEGVIPELQTHPATAQPVQKDCIVVPLEPTNEQVDACPTGRVSAREIYRAMVKAAPLRIECCNKPDGCEHYPFCSRGMADKSPAPAQPGMVMVEPSLMDAIRKTLRDSKSFENLGYNTCHAESQPFQKDSSGVYASTYRQAGRNLSAKIDAVIAELDAAMLSALPSVQPAGGESK